MSCVIVHKGGDRPAVALRTSVWVGRSNDNSLGQSPFGQRQQPGDGESVSPMIVYEGWSGLFSVRMIVNHRSKAQPHLVAIQT